MKRNMLLALTFAAFLPAQAAWASDRQIRMANEGDIRDRWQLADGATLAAPGYPAVFADRGDDVCMAIGYAINPDGTTSDFALLKAWNSSAQDQEPVAGFWNAFEQASAQALSAWRFKPRPEISTPETTYTVATMHFTGKQAADVAGLRSRCAVEDLKAFVQQQKSDRFMDSLSKYDLDRARRREEELHMARAAARARAIFENDSK